MAGGEGRGALTSGWRRSREDRDKSRPARRWLAALLLGAALATGCGSTTRVSARVRQPADIDAGRFPVLWVAGGHTDEEIRLLRALGDHLRSGRGDYRRPTRRVELDNLEPMRAAGRIAVGTGVILLELRYRENSRARWTSHPETVCGPIGCYTRDRAIVYEVPTLEAMLTATLYDGPTARVVARRGVRAQAEADQYDSLRRQVVAQLQQGLVALFQQRVEVIEVELLDVDQPQVERAIELIADEADWRRARLLLEEAVKTPAWRQSGAATRARVLYDLAMARRFDPSTMDDLEAHFAAADRALRAAQRFDPDEPRYAAARASLARHRRRATTVRAQRRRIAAASDDRVPGVPPAPPGYGGASPRRTSTGSGTDPAGASPGGVPSEPGSGERRDVFEGPAATEQ